MNHLGRILGMLALAVVLFLGGPLLLERYWRPPAVPRNVRAQSDIESLIVALRMYQTYTGDLPTTQQGLQALVQKPTIEPLPRHWRPQVDAHKAVRQVQEKAAGSASTEELIRQGLKLLL